MVNRYSVRAAADHRLAEQLLASVKIDWDQQEPNAIWTAAAERSGDAAFDKPEHDCDPQSLVFYQRIYRKSQFMVPIIG